MLPRPHPLLGAAQVRLHAAGRTWLISGDYRVESDRTAAAFAPVPCDVFVSESTFGLPVYRWQPQAEVFADIAAWWRENAAAGRASVLAAYSLGKSQRLLAGLADAGAIGSVGPVVVHGSVARINEAYAAGGVALPACHGADDPVDLARALVVCPPSALGSPWIRRFGDAATAMVSG